jgi:MFS transporter, ACS family, solute carrier family 17 (sodium-dependent inorganic phosphate cotransporter), other
LRTGMGDHSTAARLIESMMVSKGRPQLATGLDLAVRPAASEDVEGVGDRGETMKRLETRFPAWGRRHMVVVLCAIAVLIAYTDRVNMSVAAVAMRSQFGWNQATKGTVLAAFFVGYLLCMLPAGWMANRYGGRRVLAGGVIWWSIFTVLTPLAASVSVNALIAARIGLGMGEAAVMPAAYGLFAHWVPAGERTRATAFFLSGISLGQVAGFAATGALTQQFGWPLSFYLFGVLGLAWSAIWLRNVRERPRDDLRMAASERALYAEAPAPQSPARVAAWRLLLCRAPVWAYIITHFATTWSLYMLLSWLPSYFRENLGLSMKSAGLYAAAPWVVNLLVSNSVAYVADKLVARGTGLLLVRQTLIVGGLLGLAVFLLALREVRAPDLALALICVATGFLAFVTCGLAPNTIEIAPNHASLLMGISNTIATLPGVFGVVATGWLVQVSGTYAAAFLLAASLAIAASLVYLRYGRTEPVDM